ncbi:MAG: hypothetical protein Q8920_16170 [Bacillota bacterium]|nr:hypothetical protein [Bacillota bacterium]
MENKWFEILGEYVEWEMRANKGTHTKFSVNHVAEMYKKVYGEENYKNYFSKSFMIDELLKKKSLLEIYEENKDRAFGIKPGKWIEKFNLTKGQMEAMVKKGYLLHPVYKVYEKVFTGTYANVQYYRGEDYFNHTPEEVEAWKMENIRGYKKRMQAVPTTE